MLISLRQSALVYWISYVLILVCRTAGAQCSQGAILCETFGSGPKGMLPAGQTNFVYRASACPDDGEYNIQDAVDGSCHGNAWHTVLEDHTPNDVRGNMFVVNASYQPSEFYSQKATGLCPGVTYELSLWVLNLNYVMQAGPCDDYSLRDPIIAMRIEQTDGTLINEEIKPALLRTATPTWVQLTMRFVIQTNANDVVVKLVNKGLGGCGNDLAIDDIAFRPIHPNLSIRFADITASETTVCADTKLTLSVGDAVGYPNPAYLWQQSKDNVTWTPAPGAGKQSLTINPVLPGRTYYRLRTAQPINEGAIGRPQCSAESNVLVVNGRPDAPFSLGNDLTICEGESQVLKVPSSLPNGTSFRWSDATTADFLTVGKAGLYWLETNLGGCTFRDSVAVDLQNCRLADVYVPDAFSPNNDSVNDSFTVFHAGTFSHYQLQVYDRWGNVIFSSRQPDSHWDGTFQKQPCAVGTYAWTLEYSILSAQNQEQTISRKGQVMLVR